MLILNSLYILHQDVFLVLHPLYLFFHHLVIAFAGKILKVGLLESCLNIKGSIEYSAFCCWNAKRIGALLFSQFAYLLFHSYNLSRDHLFPLSGSDLFGEQDVNSEILNFCSDCKFVFFLNSLQYANIYLDVNRNRLDLCSYPPLLSFWWN